MADTLYDTDFVGWTEQQAAALRRLGPAVSNALDLDHLIEEIESLGRSERCAAESFIALIMVHLIKIAHGPEPPRAHWRHEVGTFRINLIRCLDPGMRSRLVLQVHWTDAVKTALSDLNDIDPPPLLPEACPYTLDELTDLEGRVTDLAARLTDAPR